MIAMLTGKIILKEPDHCIINVGGVGYSVFISLTTYAKLPEVSHDVTLSIHTHVREDQLHLFGFLEPREKHLFRKLLSASGVGPKLAVTMLSHLSVEDLTMALIHGNLARLTAIPGIGKKTAERLTLELKDKLDLPSLSSSPTSSSTTRHYDDLLSALTNLGYPKQTAENVLKKLPDVGSQPLAEAIKSALKELPRL
ncbi:MAG: Holliday junction branch migration protein RuvA [Deltaproteobacteria bacterium]|nr:Holliday junction branch migration protein RuvA [Deltaproteobacteria bacterium]